MSKTKAQLSLRTERQAKEISKLHKKIRDDKKKTIKLLIEKNRTISSLKMYNVSFEKDLKSTILKLGEKTDTIRSIQTSLLRVTDQREDEKAKLIIAEAAYGSEIKKLEDYIESVTPNKQNMSNSISISKLIKRQSNV